MSIAGVLRDMGLSRKESDVYLSLLRMGTQPASVVARKIRIPRSTAHFLLESLVDRGFATHSKQKNTFYFTPEPPKNVAKAIELKAEREMEERKKQMQLLEKVSPEVESMMSAYQDIPEITFYRGKAAINNLFMKEFVRGEEHDYTFDASDYIAEQYSKDVARAVRKYYKNRHMGVKDYVIDSKKYRKRNEKADYPDTEFRYFPDKDFVLKTHLQIYGDNVMILNASESPVRVLIKHRAVAQDLRDLHQQLWKVLEK